MTSPARPATPSASSSTLPTWYHRHLSKRGGSGDKPVKLTRAQRKQLATHLETEIGQERIARAWFTQRVHAYQTERDRLWQQHIDAGVLPGDSPELLVSQQLAGMRYGIESTLHRSALPLEQRGQVVHALRDINEDPTLRVQEVFYNLNPRTAGEVREMAVRSERQVFEHQQANTRQLAVERAQLAYRSDPRYLADETEQLRLRVAALESGRRDPNQLDPKHFVASVGPAELIGLRSHEELAVIPHQDRPRTTTFQTAADAYAWTAQQLGFFRHSGRRTGQFSATVWDKRNPGQTAQAAVGPLGMVTDEVQEWRSPRPQRSRTAPGRDYLTPEPSRAPAEPRPAPEQPAESDQRLAKIEQQLKDLAADRDRLATEVKVLHGGLDAVTADRDEQKRQLAAATGEVERLKNTSTAQTAELKELRAKVVTIGVERDKFKAERDQAVGKLAQLTPKEKRYGSRERIATEQEPAAPTWRSSKAGVEPPPQRSNGHDSGPQAPVERSR
ncbi:hypothetical protein KHQ06_08075 [Nocardia tengchongensis]|uniref:Uncharacterized protein n=1 Tax=Nocardia tengchongensis TaxID=2055889 RepID=A0ABX8CSK3_9NOCA|nr:hypothetical protein [Nocardia tengchongensis]QVI22909.1 hypothetical protein KHQ06_08075 [Nocardia tengchongensis]